MNFDFLKSGEFWTAVGSIAAVALFIYTFSKESNLSYVFLQSLLNKERSFYNKSISSVEAFSKDIIDELTNSYINAVDAGVEGVEMLTMKERNDKKEQLLNLLTELGNTHSSLITTLELFSVSEAKRFFNKLKKENPIKRIYDGDKIASAAHTHCGRVVQIVTELTKEFTSRDNISPGIQRIWQIHNSVIGYDREVIIPVMELILSRSKYEVQLIENAILQGDKRRAVRLKEKYWFDMRIYHQRLSRTFKKINSLIGEFQKFG